MVVSDTLDFELAPLADVAVTVHVRGAPAEVTGHPGSRTTSFFQAGDAVSAPALPAAVRGGALVFPERHRRGGGTRRRRRLRCSATPSPTDEDRRPTATIAGPTCWPGACTRTRPTREVAVLNHGLGGNRLLSNGLGPNALARLERDVLAQPGVKWLIVLAGINDIGARPEDWRAAARRRPPTTSSSRSRRSSSARTRTASSSTAARSCRSRGSPNRLLHAGRRGRSPARQPVDRTSGRFDAVIDFDAVTRDPERRHACHRRWTAGIICIRPRPATGSWAKPSICVSSAGVRRPHQVPATIS